MSVRFKVGHLRGGSDSFDLPAREVEAVLDSVLRELQDSDDEHYQVYVTNSDDISVTTFDGGLMVLHDGPDTRYYRPQTQADAVGALNALVHRQRKKLLTLFRPEKPPQGTGPNFIIQEMGEYALHKAAWDGNFERVKQLVKAGHDVNQCPPDEETTPLVGAVAVGDAEICRLLIEHGADVTFRVPPAGFGDTQEQSLLQYARSRRPPEHSPEIIQMLKKAGASE